MQDKFYVLYYVGAKGSFVTQILNSLINPSYIPKIELSGTCHDFGNGRWQNTDNVSLTGWLYSDIDGLDTNLFSGHVTELERFKTDYPKHKIIFIDVNETNLYSMLERKFNKVTKEIKLESECIKHIKQFNITHWPSLDAIKKNPNIIKDDFFKNDIIWYYEWLDTIDFELVDYKLPFEYLIGTDSKNLINWISTNLNYPVSSKLCTFIQKYLDINYVS